jgi:hypothetical protein
MQTILDSAKTWFLEGVVYREELRVIVSEGFRATEPEDVTIGQLTISETYAIDTSTDSRFFCIRFPQFIAWQVVSESFTAFDKEEIRDDTGFMQILEKSAYFSYVNSSHGWYSDIIGPGKHYRIWTENEVIDVVACEPPVIEPWSASSY